MKYLLDTDTCIYLLRQNPKTLRRLRAQELSDLSTSSIVAFELLTGADKADDPKRELGRVEALLGAITIIPFEKVAARRAAKVRAQLEAKGRGIGPYDTLIAGHALSQGLTLVTHNTREFRRVPGLDLEDWLGTS